jgi:thymidylate synthase ThyX
MTINDTSNATVSVVDDLAPEGVAMLQALYSRSALSHRDHLEKARRTGGAGFMERYYVGYNHKSIGDCGSTTIFTEGVSILAAKAVQDWSLYSGQETSTRYIDFAVQGVVDPIGTPLSKAIIDDWIGFYSRSRDSVAASVRERHPIQPGEDPAVYERAVGARAFDVLRGFLPAGARTQLSWHTNLRQAADHLSGMRDHPLAEVRALAFQMMAALHERYPSSGFGGGQVLGVSGERSVGETALERSVWEKDAAGLAYAEPRTGSWLARGDHVSFHTTVRLDTLGYKEQALLASRPRGCVLPHFFSRAGVCDIKFLLDYGSWRDVQRHRNGVCRAPLLTTDLGFEPWYLEQLDDGLHSDALDLIHWQTRRISQVTDDPAVRQYMVALGFRVPTILSYALPAAVYVLELRSSRAVHPTLRRRVLAAAEQFKRELPGIALHVDTSPSEWDVRRGQQTITERAP